MRSIIFKFTILSIFHPTIFKLPIFVLLCNLGWSAGHTCPTKTKSTIYSTNSEIFILFLSLLKVKPCPSLSQILHSYKEKRIILRINKADCRQSAECFCEAKHADTFIADNQASSKNCFLIHLPTCSINYKLILFTPRLFPHPHIC